MKPNKSKSWWDKLFDYTWIKFPSVGYAVCPITGIVRKIDEQHEKKEG